VVMVVGVNGNGKTTTIGKLAKRLQEQGYRIMLCAADTFRAAAVEQLQVWGQRNTVPVYTAAQNADPASVAYQALEQAKVQQVDVLLIDTAGRLQNKSNLMAELQKIVKVLQKLDAEAPHSVVQILDATTGQNAVSQVKSFKECVEVTGLVVTKLDGTAKAGIVVALAEQFGLPVHAVGVGEGINDLRDFSAQDFARNLVGVKD
jgi:fused signal recognition particle receptor